MHIFFYITAINLNLKNLNSLFPVPDYEIVHVHTRSRRSAVDAETHRTVSFTSKNGTRTLHLKRTTTLARKVPIYFADLDDTASVVVKPAPVQPVSH